MFFIFAKTSLRTGRLLRLTGVRFDSLKVLWLISSLDQLCSAFFFVVYKQILRSFWPSRPTLKRKVHDEGCILLLINKKLTCMTKKANIKNKQSFRYFTQNSNTKI